jgi:peptidoglycan/LPS O-acetylase OafA/YrhL
MTKLYRPEIDGLRAVAVISVLIFHLNRQWLPGGFVGVDVFFVISGYLITSILYHELIDEEFNFLKFYQRRIARIFPAFFVVAISTIAVAYFLYSEHDLARAGSNLVAASVSLTNIKYMLLGDYFKISLDAEPFMHYWSLSIEEQYYLLFPLLLFVTYRHARRYLVPILVLIFIISLAGSIVLTPINSVWAFYLLPTRAWELFAGCTLALVENDSTRFNRVPPWVPLIGLVLIGGSLGLIQEGPSFPGWVATFPVMGTIAILIRYPDSNYVTAWLSRRFMVAIGKTSYSLYLWHWPVYSMIDYSLVFESNLTRNFLKIVTCVALAVACYIFIEKPARAYFNRPTNRVRAFSALAGALALCIPLGISIRYHNYVTANLTEVVNGGEYFPGKPGAPSVVLMGDSNGSMYGKVTRDICRDLGYSLNVIAVGAMDPLPDTRLWRDSLSFIRKSKPDYLIIAAFWKDRLQNSPERLAMAVQDLIDDVGHIILLNQPPTLPEEASRDFIRNGARPPFREIGVAKTNREYNNNLLRQVQSQKISVVDVAKYFENDNGEVLFIDGESNQNYHDYTHLSGYGAAKIYGEVKALLTSPD